MGNNGRDSITKTEVVNSEIRILSEIKYEDETLRYVTTININKVALSRKPNENLFFNREANTDFQQTTIEDTKWHYKTTEIF